MKKFILVSITIFAALNSAPARASIVCFGDGPKDQCPSGYTCSASIAGEGYCIPPGGLPLGDACKWNSQCASGTCLLYNEKAAAGACVSNTTPPVGGGTGAGGGSGSGGGTAPTKSTTTTNQGPGVDLTIQGVVAIIAGLACWVTRVAILLVVLFLVYYGLMFLWARGDPGKVEDAKKALGWGIVGVIVILGTYSIIATVANSVGAGGSIKPIPLDCSASR